MENRIIVTDFSAPFRLTRPDNRQNEGVWMNNKENKMKSMNIGNEKYCKALILWREICSGRLLLQRDPFFSNWLEKYCVKVKKEKTNGQQSIYCFLKSTGFKY